MKIGVTQSVEERIKATPLELVEKAPLVFCWETHLLKVKHRNVLLIMNASSNYTIAMTDIEPRNWNYYTLYIGNVIREIMQSMGYSEEQIQKYFELSGKPVVAKLCESGITASMNYMVSCVVRFDKKLESGVKYQWELSEFLNRNWCKAEGFDAYGYPQEFFKLDMERLGIVGKRKKAKVIRMEEYRREK